MLRKQIRFLPFYGLILTLLFSACVPQGPGPETIEPVTPVFTEEPAETSEPEPQTTDTNVPVPVDTETPDPSPTTEPAPAQPLKIAYTKDGDAWLWVEGGSPTQLTTSGGVIDIRLSDDGSVVAFLKQATELISELWAVNADGSNEHPLVTAGELRQVDPRAFGVTVNRYEFVPGSHVIAYNTRQVFEGPVYFMYNDLNLVDSGTLEKRTLLPVGEGGDFFYSPDGSQIALTTSEYIQIVNADGSNRRHVLDFQRINTASEYQFYPTPVWAADSSRMAVVIPPVEPFNYPIGMSTIYSIPVDGSAAVQVGQVEAMYLPGFTYISPDMRYVLYAKMVGEPEQNLRELHLFNLDGSGDRMLLSALVIPVGWAGEEFFTYNHGEGSETFAARPEGEFQPASLEFGVMSAKAAGPGRIAFLAVSGSTWTVNLLDGAQHFVIDSFEGMLPQMDVGY
ncbi:MAG: hypothetical protein EHM41_17560 [Chloroflexi bacterium]|nr:MAG: hypothetical protein EHM41_17560 [Chloroflexota bacterium]